MEIDFDERYFITFGSTKLRTPLRLISPFSFTSRKPPAVSPKKIKDSNEHKRLKID